MKKLPNFPPKIAPKVATLDFALKLCFHYSHKGHLAFWLLSMKISLKEIVKITQSGHTANEPSPRQ